MIKNGCLVNVADENKRVPLHVAASYGHLGTITRLLDAGANIDWQDSRGRTPLYLAVVGKHEKVVLELLHRGANVNLAHAVNRMTPLGLAAQKGHVGCVRLLIDGGSKCSIRKPGEDHHSPLEAALLRASNKNSRRFKDFVKICEMLIEADGTPPGPNAFYNCYQALRADVSPEMLRIMHLLFVAGIKPQLTLTMQTKVDPVILQWSDQYIGQCLPLQDICSRYIRRHLQEVHGNVKCATNRLDTSEFPIRIKEMLQLRHLYTNPITHHEF